MYACIAIQSAFRNPQSAIAVAYAFSPRVEAAAPDAVVLDVDGLVHLFGTPRQIAEKIAQRAAGAGMQASVAVAANPDAAMNAARGYAGVTVIAPGQEARVLGSLPVQLLGLAPEVEETLRLWGIRTFRDLAALPESGLAERLGSEGLRLRKLARGAWERPLFPAITAPEFEKAQELEYPVTQLEPLSFILASLINQLCASLEARALATNEITLRLALEGAAAFQRVLRLPVPMRHSRAFLKLLQLDLERHPPPAPVVGVWMRMEAVPPRTTQHGLYLPLAPEPEKLEMTLARIKNLVGEGGAGSPESGSPERLDTHRPDAFRIADFRLPIADLKRSRKAISNQQSAIGNRLAFRVFRPVLPAKVQVASGEPDSGKPDSGEPARVMASGVRGRVVSLAGPWRTSGDWWAPTAWSRDEWDVALDTGIVCRIYRDLATGAWFVDGYYD